LRINWHPEPNVIALALSINNFRIRLPQERWLHITEYHKELLDFQLEILLTIANPDNVFFSPKGMQPKFAAVKVFDRLADYGLAKNLIVHYQKVEAPTAFIINGICNV
jgi:hypothetical protein